MLKSSNNLGECVDPVSYFTYQNYIFNINKRSNNNQNNAQTNQTRMSDQLYKHCASVQPSEENKENQPICYVIDQPRGSNEQVEENGIEDFSESEVLLSEDIARQNEIVVAQRHEPSDLSVLCEEVYRDESTQRSKNRKVAIKDMRKNVKLRAIKRRHTSLDEKLDILNMLDQRMTVDEITKETGIKRGKC